MIQLMIMGFSKLADKNISPAISGKTYPEDIQTPPESWRLEAGDLARKKIEESNLHVYLGMQNPSQYQWKRKVPTKNCKNPWSSLLQGGGSIPMGPYLKSYF